MCRRFGTLCSSFVGGVSRKNNRNKIARLFILVKDWLKNSLSKSEREGMGMGCVQIEEQAVEGKNPKWRPVVCEVETALCWSKEGEPWGHYHPVAPLPRSNMGLFLPHALTRGLHLGSLPSTPCSSTRTCPIPFSPTSNWLRLFLSQTFTWINTLAVLSRLFLLLTVPVNMGDNVPKRQHMKFRCQGITQKNIKQFFGVENLKSHPFCS